MEKKNWHIVFCDRKAADCPVAEFIDECPPRHQVKILRFLSLLEEMGPTLPRPYADLLHDGIHELRIQLSGDHVRLLYFFCFERFIVLYFAFAKNTRRVPEKFIEKVAAYRKDLLARIDQPYLETLIHANI